MTCINARADPQIQKLLIQTADFLEPLSNHDLACTFGLCDQEQELHLCTKKKWKCKRGADFVSLNTFDAGSIQEARENCAVLDDTHIEPTGGQGQNVIHPIRDDFLPTHLYHARSKRAHRRQHNQFILAMLLMVLVTLVYALMNK